MISEKFESLSDEALFALADKMGLDLPPGLDRVFVTEEILGALEEDSRERRSSSDAPFHIEEKKFSGSELDDFDACLDAAPCLERSYNETMIRAIARDPSWAFAYWDLGEAERSALRASEGASGLFLRVTEIAEDEGLKPDHFDIPVADDDSQWYINLPRSKASYRIELRVRGEGRSRVLARSGAVAVPRLALDEGAVRDRKTLLLLSLSGLHALDIEPQAESNPRRILSGPDEE